MLLGCYWDGGWDAAGMEIGMEIMGGDALQLWVGMEIMVRKALNYGLEWLAIEDIYHFLCPYRAALAN